MQDMRDSRQKETQTAVQASRQLENEYRGSLENSTSTSLSVAVCGCGYVGTATALSLAHVGHRVTCVDVSSDRIAKLKSGLLPFYEPHAQRMLAECSDRIRFTTDYAYVARASVVVIAVGTPTFEDGTSDLGALWAAVESVRSNAGDEPVLLINKSTVPVGTIEKIRHKLRSMPSIAVVTSPEFLRQGSALKDTLYPDRIVIGSDDPAALLQARRVFEQIVQQSFAAPSYLPRPEGYEGPAVLETDSASAEMTKYAGNAFLAMKISFINEIAELCEKTGADVRQVAKGIGLDRRIGPDFLAAGLGWGGSCFPKDTLALARMGERLGAPMHMVEATRATNKRQRERLVQKISETLGGLKGKTVLLLGMAFKPGTDDLRDAPSLDVARQMIDAGAEVSMHDPVVRPGDVYALAENANGIVLITEWPEYKHLDWERIAGTMRGRPVFDGRNSLDQKRISAAGLEWHGMGAK